MNISTPLLLITAGLLLMFGLVALVAITLVCKRCRGTVNQKSIGSNDHESTVDPWIEAGKRVKSDIHEPE